jgi:hypothetical protein
MARDWNAAYEGGETPWDKGYASPPLIEFLNFQPISGRVLVPGCGAGHDVRALAAEGAEVDRIGYCAKRNRQGGNFSSFVRRAL